LELVYRTQASSAATISRQIENSDGWEIMGRNHSAIEKFGRMGIMGALMATTQLAGLCLVYTVLL
jgi:hypothetical protein